MPVRRRMSQIPLIHIADFDNDAAALGHEIGLAARDTGFFCITGHGIAQSLVDEVFVQSKRFFAQNTAAKEALSIRRSPHNRGYVALGDERLDASKPGDVKAAFNIGLDMSPDHPEVLAGKPFRGVNRWPDQVALPAFRVTMLTYFEVCHVLGMRLHRALAHDLGIAENFFDDKLDQPLTTLRLLHYPPRPERSEPGQMGAGEHTDYGNITLLATDDAAG